MAKHQILIEKSIETTGTASNINAYTQFNGFNAGFMGR